MSNPNVCDVPPEGWYCTREKGHEGPCAARPDRGKIVVGALYDCVILDKPGGKRTGQTRPVIARQLVYHWKPKDAIRSVKVETVDDQQKRVAWVEPKYLLARSESNL